MKLLVLTAFYPVPNGTHERMFVHVRNQHYRRQGISVTVLNFGTERDYEIDGIRVISLKTYVSEPSDYDILVSHSANLRNHYRFIKRYEKRFRHFVFFFHGHEIMYLNRDYPQPYAYMTKGKPHKRLAQDVYDSCKIGLWKRYYKKLAGRSEFVFVSRWLLERFKKNSGLTERDLNHRCHVINNSVGADFETHTYDHLRPKDYDFITIRSNLDGSSYSLDVVTELARRNPDQKFLVIGKGRFFDYNEKPENVELIQRTMEHGEMLDYLDRARCALLPTRHDTQGVMACEMAAYGIPLITSDIEVCREIFGHNPNVRLIGSTEYGNDLTAILDEMKQALPYPKDQKYYAENTIDREIRLFHSILAEDQNRQTV